MFATEAYKSWQKGTFMANVETLDGLLDRMAKLMCNSNVELFKR